MTVTLIYEPRGLIDYFEDKIKESIRFDHSNSVTSEVRNGVEISKGKTGKRMDH